MKKPAEEAPTPVFNGLLCAALALLIGITSAPAAPAGRPAGKDRKVVFVFLTSGPGRRKYEKAEVERMQAEHIGNFKRLHAAGKLSMAGPCADPDKKTRGIVLLTVPGVKDMPDLFEPDPYVQEDLLKVEAFEATAPVYDLGTPAETGIDMHTIAILEQVDTEARRAVRPDVKRYAALPATERPAVAVAAARPGKVRLVLFFRTSDLKAVQATVDADPLVAKGALRAHVWQQWLGKGTLAPAPG